MGLTVLILRKYDRGGSLSRGVRVRLMFLVIFEQSGANQGGKVGDDTKKSQANDAQNERITSELIGESSSPTKEENSNPH